MDGVIDVFVQHSYCQASRPRHCMKHTLSLSLSLSSNQVRLHLYPDRQNIDVIVCNFNVPDYKHNGFVNGGRKIEGDGASAPLYQGPLA